MARSLRVQLLRHLLPAIVVVWLVSASAAAWQTYRHAQTALDASLSQSASVIHALVAHEIHEHRGSAGSGNSVFPGAWVGEIRSHLLGPAPDSPLSFQVSTTDGSVSLRSPDAPNFDGAGVSAGYSNLEQGARQWRVFTLANRKLGVIVKVAEDSNQRAVLLKGLVWSVLLPLTVGGPLLAMLIWLSLGRGLVPLREMVRSVKQRDPSHLSPLEIESPSLDLVPMVQALDHLFAQLRQAIERERGFTADAAHELRTPLAGIRAQAQVALNATSERARLRAIGQLLAGVDRATRLIGQLLALSRLDASTQEGPPAGTTALRDVTRITQQVLAELAEDALAKDTDLSLDLSLSEDAGVAVTPEALEMLVRNVADNAIRYTPVGGTVAVALCESEGCVRLTVDDSGPGVAPGNRDKVFRRFYRERRQTAPGSGLGLSIVARIGDLARGSIRLDSSSLGGLRVVVELPLTAAHTAASRSPNGANNAAGSRMSEPEGSETRSRGARSRLRGRQTSP